MKKLLLSLIMVLAVIIVNAQVPRQMVVLEIGTGTWCTYCPGAAMGADDLLENGCFVAVVENHNGDAYTNDYSNARNSYYAVSGYPTAVFDGLLKVVGGNHTNSMYPQYLPKYNQRIAIPANMEMSMEVSNVGPDYTVVVTMEQVAPIINQNMVLQFCVTQSNISVNWQGQNHLEHVNRLMVPDESGTPVSFTSGDIQTATLTFSLDAAVPLEDIEFVAFVQANTGKEVLQGIKRGAIDLTPGFDADATQVQPGGTVNFTNSTFGGYIGVPETYQWFFDGGTPASSTDQNPSVVYDICGSHNVTYIVNRGGQIDTIMREAYINVGPIVNITTTPGDTVCDWGSITLDGTTAGATSYYWVHSGETTPVINVDTTGFGLGAHTLTLVVTTPDCPATKTHQIFFDNCTGVSTVSKGVSMSVYPNPSNGSFKLEVSSDKSFQGNISIMNTLGNTVYTAKDIAISKNFSRNISLKNIPSGIYFLTLENGDNRTTQKIIIK